MMDPEAKYEMSVYWSDEDDCFLVEVPDLPGCMADGKTRAKAVENAAIVVQEWLETAKALGRPIPQPTSRLALA